MDNKSYKNMNTYKNRIQYDLDDKFRGDKNKVQPDTGEHKSGIWWFIMIFCIVYGIQQAYRAILMNGGL